MSKRLCFLIVVVLLVTGLLAGTSLTESAVAAPAPAPWDFNNDAWAYLRANTPESRNVYRPTWLPDRFDKPGIGSTYASGLVYGVSYRNERDWLLFGSTANSCGGNGVPEPITVRGHAGFIMQSSDCRNEIRVYWREGEEFYGFSGGHIDATGGPSREEMLRIAASLEPVGVDGRPLSAAGPPTTECFAETRFCISGAFLARWRATGGVTINGFPLSGEFAQQLEDGKTYTVQYFERVRLEAHPENAAPYNILLGQFGRRIHGRVDPPIAANPQGPQFFPETGHNVGSEFYSFWLQYGLEQFGYPITEVLTETLEDGQQYQVQYFERARFEYHPDNPWPYKVLLGQFGRQILANR